MKKFVFRFIDGEEKIITGDHWAMAESIKIYKDVQLSSVIETSAKPRELIAAVSLAQLKWFEILEQ